MPRLKPLAAPALLAAGLLTPTPADAGGVMFFSRSGRDSRFAAGVHGYDKHPDSPAPRRTLAEAPRVVAPLRTPVWRETSRLEYHPTRLTPHGDHHDLTPGRYHFESTGAWTWE